MRRSSHDGRNLRESAKSPYSNFNTRERLRFWEIATRKLSAEADTPEGEHRDVVIWDLGGQDEYRLVHQLFLHDTTVALILVDPTRGRTAFDEVEAWNARLERQIGVRPVVKILVGAKMDHCSDVVDVAALERLKEKCGFAVYCETSAKTGRGIAELCQAVTAALDWDSLAKTSRPQLFQRIRDEIEDRRHSGEVVLPLSDLEKAIGTDKLDDLTAVGAVAEQLAAQGVIADTRLSSNERVLVLQVGEIERYAASLIIQARNNPHRVPALEERRIASPEFALPGIKPDERLPRIQERVVLECVSQLLLEHGICFEHHGLLVFPTLFSPTESDDDVGIPRSVSLCYDFSGAIDNIYASLIAWLVVSKNFGRVRLWRDRAEFESGRLGASGLRKVSRERGLAHLDVYFEERTPLDMRAQFISFVEEHLRRHNIEISERILLSCPECHFHFPEDIIRDRIQRGESDVGCLQCDSRIELLVQEEISESRAQGARGKTVALRTMTDRNVERIANKVKRSFNRTDWEHWSAKPIRILHLSDLHFTDATDVLARIRPLVDDLRDSENGLGLSSLDYLILSGDLTNRATPEEFEKALKFTTGLIDAFNLSAQRCLVVPGNHDLSWDEDVYLFRSRRNVLPEQLTSGTYFEQQDGILVRIDENYPLRFRNFDEYFFHPLTQVPYPMDFENQGIPYLFSDSGLQFLTFNSCWEVDEWFPERASIHHGSFARGLDAAQKLLGTAADRSSVLRIAVWHHPVTGNEKIHDVAFVEQLRKASFCAALHGHVHEERPDLVGYQYGRMMHVAGTGSFSSGPGQRPESTPRLYNLLEISPDRTSIKVHTRCQRTEGGTWEGWARWPSETPNQLRTVRAASSKALLL